MRIHNGHELIRFGIGCWEDPLMGSELSEKLIADHKKEPVAPAVITVGEMKKRFNEISLSFPDGKSQRFYDKKPNNYPLTHRAINDVVAGVIREALNQTKNHKLFTTHFLPIIEQLTEQFSDVLDLTTFTDAEARVCFQDHYCFLGKSYLMARFAPNDKQDAFNRIKAASMRATDRYAGQFNHLPKIIAAVILLQYTAKISRSFVDRKRYPKLTNL